MSFIEQVRRARELLRREGRLSLRAVQREFGLDDGALGDLICELVDVQQVAAHEGKILRWIGAVPGAGPAAGSRSAPDPGQTPERRQLTVLFCDLVDSTRLAGGRDAEDWREVVRSYQEAASKVIERFDGHVAQYLGDGLLVYFGWPRAHEDDAERAVRAGLGVLDAVGAGNEALRASHGVELAVRIGIHTGAVVVGEMGAGESRETLAVGDTTNVAARLQAEAEPDTVVLSAATLRLTPGVFVTGDLGERALRGVRRPVHVYQALQASGVRSRLDVLAAAELTPFVGREQEIGLLEDRLSQVAEGRGQAVLICGEAGIGKSRLLHTFREALAERPHTWLECRGSPYTQDTALNPILEVLQQGLGFRSDDPPAVKLAAMEAGLSAVGLDLEETVPFLAALHGVPLSGRYDAPDLSPEGVRKRTLALLTEWVLRLGQREPLVLLMEDLHWMDPSTVELLGTIVDQVPTASVLLLATYRPDFEPPWGARSHTTPVLLSRFTQPQIRDLVRKVARERTLPDDWVGQIVERSDGVPLFAEELTKAVMESNPLLGEAPSTPELKIPETLQDSLMARLDQLGPVKELAQMGSVLGREFAYDLLLKVSPMTEPQLRATLEAAVREELFYQRGTPPDSQYLFKHALIRDAAYESLLRSARQRLHLRVAETLISRMPGLTEAHPELVAHHLAESDQHRRAIDYWQRAGELADRRVAHEEASRHLRRGIALIPHLPDDAERRELELGLQVAFARALSATRGYAREETQAVWERARALCDVVADPVRGGAILFGQCAFYLSGGVPTLALEPARRYLDFAEDTDDDFLVIGANEIAGVVHFLMGDFAESRDHLAIAAGRRDPARHRFVEAGYIDELGLTGRGWLSWALWHLGLAEQSEAAADEAMDEARSLGQPYTQAFVGFWAATAAAARRDWAHARQIAVEVRSISEKHGFPLMEAFGGLTETLAIAHLEPDTSVVDRFRDFMTMGSQHGNQGGLPWVLEWLALMQRREGRREEANATLQSALSFTARTGQRFRDAELLRLQGEWSLADGDDSASAEAAFRRAIETARSQGSLALELRAATSLARLWCGDGRRREAREVLARVYDALSEGLATPDAVEARALERKIEEG